MRDDTQILRFDSAAAMGEFYATKYPARMKDTSRDSWTNESPADAVRYAATGRDHLVADAQALIERIEGAGIELDWPRWENSMTGALPNVPAYLAGLPETMRAKVQSRNDRAPLRIYADLTTSAGISHEQLTKRGVAMLALAMLVSAQRPVELFAVVGLSDGYDKATSQSFRATLATVRIPAAPLELASACYALTSAAYAREIGYKSLKAAGAGGGWAWNLHPFDSGKTKFIEQMREALDLQAADLYLEPPHYEARRDAILTDPVAWINKELAKLQATVDAA